MSVLPLVAGSLAASSQAADQVAPRASMIVQRAAEDGVNWESENNFKTAPMVASALFATGRDAEARAVLARHMPLRPLVEYFDAEFPLYSTMHCYMTWKDSPGKYTPELKRKVLEYVAAATGPSDATTYNHHWMLATGLVLAYQEWGDKVSYVFKNNPNDRTGRAWALRELDRIVRFSHTEDLSETYAKYTFGPILTLHDHADDPVLKAKCRAALDSLCLRLAAFFFKGHSAGSTRRTYGPMRKRAGDIGPSWLYFGGPAGPERTVLPMALSVQPGAAARKGPDRRLPHPGWEAEAHRHVALAAVPARGLPGHRHHDR